MKKLNNWKLWSGWTLVLLPIIILLVSAAFEIIGWITSLFTTTMTKAQQAWALLFNTLTVALFIVPGMWLIRSHYRAERVEVNINRIS